MIPTKCRIIGLTGGIATGKSTVSKILKDKGFIIIDADIIAREVVEVGKPAYNEIVNTFGKNILDENQNINRKKLGELVFSKDSLRIKLNKITHPHIFQSIRDEIDKYCLDDNLIFLDVPLLFEEYPKFLEYNIKFHEIWFVYVDLDTQIKRLMKRDNLNLEDSLKRINSQVSMDEKIKRADRVLDNNGDILMLKSTILKALKDFE